jgi:hypothetical protein
MSKWEIFLVNGNQLFKLLREEINAVFIRCHMNRPLITEFFKEYGINQKSFWDIPKRIGLYVVFGATDEVIQRL